MFDLKLELTHLHTAYLLDMSPAQPETHVWQQHSISKDCQWSVAYIDKSSHGTDGVPACSLVDQLRIRLCQCQSERYLHQSDDIVNYTSILEASFWQMGACHSRSAPRWTYKSSSCRCLMLPESWKTLFSSWFLQFWGVGSCFRWAHWFVLRC